MSAKPPGPDVVIVAAPSLTFAPAPSATTPLAPKPVAGETPPDVVTEVEPAALMTPPRLATIPLAPAPCVANAFDSAEIGLRAGAADQERVRVLAGGCDGVADQVGDAA